VRKRGDGSNATWLQSSTWPANPPALRLGSTFCSGLPSLSDERMIPFQGVAAVAFW
jgi:hypothetical protein